MEHDDSMLSTTSSQDNDDTYDDENLFPGDSNATPNTSYIAAQTPQNDHLNAAAPGELSPPRSQQANTIQTNGFDAPIEVDANEMTEDEAIGMRDVDEQDEKNRPGYGWKNKKAQEDMQRAWDHIVDKDFDIRQYGDPLIGK